jgi:hypothetical protein
MATIDWSTEFNLSDANKLPDSERPIILPSMGFEAIDVNALAFDKIADILAAAAKSWHEKLKSHLKEHLQQLGFEFETEDAFIKFFKNRLSRLHFKKDPDSYFFYLDFDNENGSGKYVCGYSEKWKIDIQEYKVSLTIGNLMDID